MAKKPKKRPSRAYLAASLPQCNHHGQKKIKVGPYQILAGGLRYLQPENLDRADVVIPLEARLPLAIGQSVNVLGCTWRDLGPPPTGFEAFLEQQVVPLLEEGKKIIVYCIGSHGRTGTFIASLISVLEPETADPVAAVRSRHCHKAVETREQAEFVFSLRSEILPQKYKEEFKPQEAAVNFFKFNFNKREGEKK